MLKTSSAHRATCSVFIPLYHPFLFMLALLFYVYSRTHVITSPNQLARPILFYSVLLIILSRLAIRVIRDPDLTGLSLTIFVLGVCATYNFFTFAMMIIGLVLVLWFIYSWVRRQKISITQVSLLLDFIALVMVVVFSASPISALVSLSKTSSYLKGNNNSLELANFEVTPDIYYIVLDGYVRADMLQELFGYDNSDFVQSLGEKGFIVPIESRSNYPKTAVSVPSTLNMDYIVSVVPDLQDSYYWWLMEYLIDYSRVGTTLEHLGYRSVSVTTDWGITNNPTADIHYSPKLVVLNDFENFLLQVTPLGAVATPLFARFAFVQSNQAHYELLLYQFATLAKLSALDSPKFVFAHIIAPHPPFVMGRDGNFQSPGYSFNFNDASDYPFSKEDYRKGYISQVEFVNKQIQILVDSILEESETPPIIIIQADHGSGLFTDLSSPDTSCLKERFSIFAAYYLPGMDRESIPEDITPVNIFRIIFNRYFNANLPMLDRIHYFSNIIQIYNEQDVTSRVDSCSIY